MLAFLCRLGRMIGAIATGLWQAVTKLVLLILDGLAIGLVQPIFKIITFTITYIALAVASLALVVGGVFWFALQTVPDPEPAYRYRSSLTTKVSDAVGRETFRVAQEYRMFEPIDTIPTTLLQAFIAAEDQRFYEHDGLDGESFARAMLQNVRRVYQGGRALGGSTISQQVAKMKMGSERTAMRKLREAIYTTKMEALLTKDQILEIYLNEVFFGVNTYGVAAASERYFGKRVQELNLSEMAFLAALPKGPVNYHPTRKRESAKARRDWVISRMLELDMISRVEAEVATSRSLPESLHYGLRGQARGYFNLQVKRELEERFGANAVGTQGFDVVTTYEPEYQAFAETTLRRHLLELDALMGYRGPVARLDLSDPAWAKRFVALDSPAVFENWHLAVVVDVRHAYAGVVLPNGARGRITLQDMAWAREYSDGEALNPLPRSVSAVLKEGDVLLVESRQERSFDRDTDASLDAAAQEVKSQAEARRSFVKESRFKLRQMPALNGAAVILDLPTGHLKAVAGGFSSDSSAYNRATQAMRQPGSTVKPFVALAAIEHGYRPSTVLEDKEITMILPGEEIWKPQNADGQFWERVSLLRALVHSRNVPMVNLHRDLGAPVISKTLQDVGLYDEYIKTPSVVLGANETSLIRLAGAYAALANEGEYREPTVLKSVRDKQGLLLYSADEALMSDCVATALCYAATPRRVASSYASRSVNGMLREVMVKGTGKHVQKLVNDPIMGKTGTTNGARDAWFVGFYGDTLIAVFVGYDTPRSLGENATGGRVAGPVFADLYRGYRMLKEGEALSDQLVAQFDPADAFDKATRGSSWYFERSGGVAPQTQIAGGDTEGQTAWPTANAPIVTSGFGLDNLPRGSSGSGVYAAVPQGSLIY